MKRINTKHNLEFTTEELELLVEALRTECSCRGQQITELKDYIDDTSNPTRQKDITRRCELIEEYKQYRKLLGELGEIIGRHFVGNDY